MIKVKTRNDGAVSIRIHRCKTQAQLTGEIGVTIKGLVQFATLRVKADDDPKHLIATALTLGKIFDDCMKDLERAISDGLTGNEMDVQDVDITVDMNDIDEIMKQLKEMQEDENGEE